MTVINNRIIEKKLITAGVRNLQEFGCPNCDKDNILIDDIYKQFFLSMLQENKGQAGHDVDIVIDSLICKITK